jgi:hypothetical protein
MYRGSVRVFSLAMIGIGVAILASTLIGGGGATSVGVFLGVAFTAVGGGRLWLSMRMSR